MHRRGKGQSTLDHKPPNSFLPGQGEEWVTYMLLPARSVGDLHLPQPGRWVTCPSPGQLGWWPAPPQPWRLMTCPSPPAQEGDLPEGDRAGRILPGKISQEGLICPQVLPAWTRLGRSPFWKDQVRKNPPYFPVPRLGLYSNAWIEQV